MLHICHIVLYKQVLFIHKPKGVCLSMFCQIVQLNYAISTAGNRLEIIATASTVFISCHWHQIIFFQIDLFSKYSKLEKQNNNQNRETEILSTVKKYEF